MSITVSLPAVLAKLADGQRDIVANGNTVGEAIGEITARFPELAPRLRAPSGEQYPYVTIYLNDEDIRLGGGFDATVRDGDEVVVVPAIAGG